MHLRHNPQTGGVDHLLSTHAQHKACHKTMINDQTTFDDRRVRCPKLGGEVTFAYCRQEAGDLPCQRVVLCWHLYFPIESHLEKILTDDQRKRFLSQQPKDKITTLVELIEEAKKRMG
jgi:hypothetical protein